MIKLKQVVPFMVDYQKCQLLHVCSLAEELSAKGVRSSTMYAVIMLLCVTIQKIMFGEKQYITPTNHNLLAKIKEALSCIRAGIFTNLDAYMYGHDIMKSLAKSQEECLTAVEQNTENRNTTEIKQIRRSICRIDEVQAVWPLIVGAVSAKIFSIFDLQIKLLRHEYLMKTSTSNQQIAYEPLDA